MATTSPPVVSPARGFFKQNTQVTLKRSWGMPKLKAKYQKEFSCFFFKQKTSAMLRYFFFNEKICCLFFCQASPVATSPISETQTAVPASSTKAATKGYFQVFLPNGYSCICRFCQTFTPCPLLPNIYSCICRRVPKKKRATQPYLVFSSTVSWSSFSLSSYTLLPSRSDLKLNWFFSWHGTFHKIPPAVRYKIKITSISM